MLNRIKVAISILMGRAVTCQNMAFTNNRIVEFRDNDICDLEPGQIPIELGNGNIRFPQDWSAMERARYRAGL